MMIPDNLETDDWKADVFRPDVEHKLYFKTDVSRSWVLRHWNIFVHNPHFGEGKPGVSLALIYLFIFQFRLNLYLIVSVTKHNPIYKFCNNLLFFYQFWHSSRKSTCGKIGPVLKVFKYKWDFPDIFQLLVKNLPSPCATRAGPFIHTYDCHPTQEQEIYSNYLMHIDLH